MSGGGELIVSQAVDPEIGPAEPHPDAGARSGRSGRRRSLWGESFARLIRMPAASITANPRARAATSEPSSATST